MNDVHVKSINMTPLPKTPTDSPGLYAKQRVFKRTPCSVLTTGRHITQHMTSLHSCALSGFGRFST